MKLMKIRVLSIQKKIVIEPSKNYDTNLLVIQRFFFSIHNSHIKRLIIFFTISFFKISNKPELDSTR